MSIQRDIARLHTYAQSQGLKIHNSNRWQYDNTTRSIYTVHRSKKSITYICSFLHELGHSKHYTSPWVSILKPTRIPNAVYISLILDDERRAWDTGLSILEALGMSRYKSEYLRTYAKHYTSYVKAVSGMDTYALQYMSYPYIRGLMVGAI